MKILSKRKFYTNENSIFISTLIVLLYLILKPKTLTEIIIVSLSIISISILFYFICDVYLYPKINLKKFLKYYEDNKYIIIDGDLEKEINIENINIYLSKNKIKDVSIYEHYNINDNSIYIKFIFTYNYNVPNSKKSEYKDNEYIKTFLVYDKKNT